MLNETLALLRALPHKFLSLTLALLVVGLVFALAERAWPLHRAPLLRRHWLADVGYYYLGAIAPAFGLMLVMHLTALLLRPLGPLPWHPWVAALPAGVAFVASLVLAEVTYYWAHRLAHEVPFLWRFHAIHHSPTHVDWLVNTRAHPLDLVFLRGFSLVSMVLLGFAQRAPQPGDWLPGAYSFWMVSWAFFVHANMRVRLGWLEYVVSSPAFHHWHHVNGDPAHVNKNYAATQPWVDMLFGSFYLPRHAWPAQYGIDEALAPGMAQQLLDPLRARRARPVLAPRL